MAIFAERNMISRERRLFTLSAFQGNNQALLEELSRQEPRQMIRTLTQANPDDILEALDLLSTITDVVTVIHGVSGCAAAALDFYRNSRGVWYSTALNEQDTILGSDDKLRATLERAYREHHPRAIFILGTPVVAINNDDINSVILDLEEEYNTRIISIVTDGFKSKAGVNGIDITLHGIGKHLVGAADGEDPDPAFEDFINLIAVSENRRGVDALSALIRSIGAGVNVIPRYAAVSRIARAGEAKASIAINDSRADIFLQGLPEKTGVVSLRSRTPIGPAAVSDWLLAAGKSIHCGDAAAAIIERETKAWESRFAEKPLAGKGVFLALPAGEAVEAALFLKDLGAEITGISIDSADGTIAGALERLPSDVFVHVGNGQPFELAAIFSKNRPDFFVAGTSAAWAAGFGALPVSVEHQTLYGYGGAEELIRAIKDAEKLRGYADYLFANGQHPYKEAWLKKSANWHVKLEVK
ncbi:nitrogenase [Spirochaetia bacterium]|nr:nitrogenase [Spirochaetia bacterium]